MAYATQFYSNTYLFLLPYELQDYIYTLQYRFKKQLLFRELIRETDSTSAYISSKTTLYAQRINIIIDNDWRQLVYYFSGWISDRIHRGDRIFREDLYKSYKNIINRHLLPPICLDNDLQCYKVVENNIHQTLKKIYETHGYMSKDYAKNNIREDLIVALWPLNYQELISLCEYIKETNCH